MARVPPIREEDHPELASLINDIKGQRGRLSPLYGTLAQSPPVAEGWLHFLSSVRKQTQLKGTHRELVILLVALINSADYEFRSHLNHGRKEGMSDEKMHAVLEWATSPHFDDDERAVLAYCDASTRTVKVSDEVFAGIRSRFTDRQIVELTALIGAYNTVSRLLVALDVGH
jgi:alkylhydroperoxidase family enzyme